MSEKLRKIIAITALVFMVAFFASFMVYLIDKTLLNNSIGLITILTGCLAVGLYLVIVFDNKYGKQAQQKRLQEIINAQENAESDKADAQEKAESDKADAQEKAESDKAEKA